MNNVLDFLYAYLYLQINKLWYIITPNYSFPFPEK